MSFKAYTNEPIAIIGSGCRFPGGANTPSKLWDLLKEPRDVQSQIPHARFNADGFYHPDNTHHGTSNVRHSYFLSEDHRHFDAHFFGIKPVEAHSIDPQQRLLLETVYESLEAAGLTIDALQGSQTAVYVGLMGADYADLLGRDTSDFPTYFATGTARSIISNRVSYFFDWRGPSMTIDTACSSSLVAVHQAVQLLRSGESRVAIAAGANLLLGPEQYIAESNLKMLSPDGRSYMWDERANGYARGEGMAAVVLKTLTAAIEDGDSIECIIRETGINQDGKTKGITMPSPVAQAALIEATYAKAGLDLSRSKDRPQYFEAHGTGTPAGDPTEAEAIYTAFFKNNSPRTVSQSPLFVGSIKTVIGHTEGTAGLAGLLKASLALQNGIIPPNMLFKTLAPSVKPFYGDLQITRESLPWPATDGDAPRRASVNSFGFGGANAHCILESYASTKHARANRHKGEGLVCTPFTFSAVSETSLKALVTSFSTFLQGQTTVDLSALSHTLTTRRTIFPARVAFAATDVPSLCAKLDQFSNGTGEKVTVPPSLQSRSGPLRVLGIFTGQGAQWAGMGAELLQLPAVETIVDRMEESLANLPLNPPKWSLRQELLASKAASRVGEAALSQPLCTAIQVILVNLLRAAGIEFSAVVGHSSGEIGAAYAAGYLSATDAIRIAYYRGATLHLARGKNDQQGAMIAVGTSYEDAQALCKLRRFRGKVCVAASNSATSVTISGDLEAINHIQVVCDEEKKFARVLKVDKAYHSHHMVPCSEAYLQSLRTCGIHPKRPEAKRQCAWISSVYHEHIDSVEDNIADSYWVSNLVSPVLFSQALEHALGEDQFDLAIEVGPHPALKGPASQVIQDTLGISIPYTGVLSRGVNSINAFSGGLGYIWTTIGGRFIDFTRFDALMNNTVAVSTPLKGLPTYAWDHDRTYWYESRLSKAFRERNYLPHELLGTRCAEFSEREVRWNNHLIPKELGWISGHRIQGQMVFPAAGYMSTAFEAVREIAGDEPLKLIQLADFTIGQPMVFDTEDSVVETLISLTQIQRHEDELTCRFCFFSTGSKDSGPMSLNADGEIQVIFGTPDRELLPPKPEPQYAMTAVETDQFYKTFASYGYHYTGPFKALSSMERKLGVATGLIAIPQGGNPANPLLMHPAPLDAAIQAILVAYCFPGDGRLQSIQLPTRITRITINPALCAVSDTPDLSLAFVSNVGQDDRARVDGDVDIYPTNGSNAVVRLEGMQTRPMVPPTESTDVNIFSEPIWGLANPDLMRAPCSTDVSFEFGFVLERVAYYFLRDLVSRTTQRDRETCDWYYKNLFSYADQMLHRVTSGSHPFASNRWIADTRSDISNIIDSHPESIDLRIMRAVGENIIPAIRRESTMLEAMMQDNMLNDFYVTGLGMEEYLKNLTFAAKQIGHRHPSMNVLEIGAGTGGATKSILRELGDAFASYTFTDISSGFFEKAMRTFKSYESRMTFKTLDIEKDIIDQGYAPGSFDLIIASLVLHATTKLEQTMNNVRQLLKPGGYLLMLEITDNDPLRFGFIFGGLPGWWLGTDDGRTVSPCIESSQWDHLLQKTGFAGIDSIAPHRTTEPLPLCVMLAQAVDDRVNLLRDPFLSTDLANVTFPELTIIGGNTTHTSNIVSCVVDLLTPYYPQINRLPSLLGLDASILCSGGSVICLQDLDDPALQSPSEAKLRGLQSLFEKSKNVLWITLGYKQCEASSKMIVGFTRCLLQEMRHLRVQFLDFPKDEEPSARLISEAMIRFSAFDTWEGDGRLRDMLWSFEPEIAFEQGRAVIPRVMLSQPLNQRYNSSRRRITQSIELESQPVTLFHRDDEYAVRLTNDTTSTDAKGSDGRGRIEIQVRYSILKSVRIGALGQFFVVLGTNTATGSRVISLSTSLSSRITVPESWTQPCSFSQEHTVNYLINFYLILVCDSCMSDLARGDMLLALEPSDTLAKFFEFVGLKRGILTHLVTSRVPAPTGPWTAIHPRASKREIRAMIPHNVARLVCCTDEAQSSALYQDISSTHPVETFHQLTHANGRLNTNPFDYRIPEALEFSRAQAFALPFSSDFQTAPVVALQDLIYKPHQPDMTFSSVVDWGAGASVAMRVEPVDARPLFRDDRTYWLVGLTGGLGLSLCRWMINKGAKHIALSSRAPKVDPRWLAEFTALGATVKIYANDVTDRQSVRSVYQQIRSSMPPVAGVCQGAMVLHDTLFLDLTMERMEKVLKPKVQGAVHLDEIFSCEPLDFFVFLSSMASVTGNPGQAAYAAANMFLAGLAAQRRQQGLAASTVHIGAIIGNGYVTRELTLAQQMALQKVGNMWMSEQDFYQIFAEAVIASPPQVGPNPEYFTGLRIFYSDEEDKPQYATNPIFGHLIRHRRLEGHIAGGSSSTVSTKVQLARATTEEQVDEIMKASLTAKLQAALQIPPGRDVINMNADTLGIDSLIALDMRSWFLKELDVDMPVLKIISGSTMGELLNRAREILPTKSTPNVVAGASPDRQPLPISAEDGKSDPTVPSSTKPQPGQIRVPPVKDAAQGTPLQTAVQVRPAQQQEAQFVEREKEEDVDDQRDKIIITVDQNDPALAEDLLLEGVVAGSTTSSAVQILLDFKASPSELSGSLFEDISQPLGSDNGVQRVLPISFSQSRFWFLSSYLEDKTTFNVTFSICLRGQLRVDGLAQAVATVGQRHESLRTRFFTDQNHQPMQAILESSILRLEKRTVSGAQEVEKEFARLKDHVYDLENGQTMRIILLSITPTIHQLLLGYHHINMDGVAFEIFFSDLQKAYDDALPADNGLLQYPDFAVRQRKQYTDGKWSTQLEYWRKEFASIPPPLPLLPLSASTSRVPLTEYATHLASYRIPSELSAQVHDTCKRMKVTPFQFYLAVYRIMLSRFAEVDDICIGVSDANRTDSDVQQSLGCYLNLLPVRFSTSLATNSFSQAVRDTKARAQQAFANSVVPFDVLLNELNVPRASNHSPLFQVLLNYRQGVAERRRFCDCDCDWTHFDGGQTAYDLNLDIVDNAGGDALLRLSVQKEYYSALDCDIFLKSMVHLVTVFSHNPATRLNRPALHAADSVDDAISLGRGAFRSPNWKGTLIDRIDELAAVHAHAPAVSDGHGHQLIYDQMNERVNAIAHALSHAGVGDRSKVGVFQDASTDWVCSLLAVLRLGAIYVPLDPRVVSNRLASILDDCRPTVLLTDATTHAAVPASHSTVKQIDVSQVAMRVNQPICPNVSTEDSVMAILYTSGSTGVPKGVVMKHSVFRNHVETVHQEWMSSLSVVRALQQSSFSFDMSLVQILWPLCAGGTVYVVPQSARGDPVAITKLVASEKVTVTAATPTEYISWVQYGDQEALRQSAWALGICGGEKVTASLTGALRQVQHPGFRVFNCYGPTEVTFFSHMAELTGLSDDGDYDGENSTALTPWANYATYILDTNHKPLPVGVPGQVAVGGMGVASGYLNLKDFTQERFVPDHLAPTTWIEHGWTMMHLTGDRGRLQPNGTLLLEGRMEGDTQIKLRGLRVDLQDIEATIEHASQGRILHAVVSRCEESDILVAHVELPPSVSHPNTEEYLQQLLVELPLPQYMRPTLCIPINQLPRTASGKIDRRATQAMAERLAPQPSRSDLPDDTTDETVSRLLKLWEEILPSEVMGRFTVESTSDFFHVGGSSLLLMRLQALIQDTFSIDMPLVNLFDASTLGGMAATIDARLPRPATATDIAEASVLKTAKPVRESAPLHGTRIDWEAETAIPSGLPSSIVLGAHAPRAVILTGSTGFLGRALLRELVASPSIEKVYCIAVRATSSPSDPVFASAKVVVYEGDQSQPALGLAAADLARILAAADAIIHNGADVSFLKSYSSLRQVNVDSTKQLATWAVQYGLPFHYISTASVATLSGQPTWPVSASLRHFPPAPDGSNGYIASKWASERYLERMSVRYGLPLMIHRPSSLTGADAADTDVMGALLRYSKMLRAIPQADTALRGVFDFISVQRAAREIVDTVRLGVLDPEVRYAFQGGEMQIETGPQLRPRMEALTGDPFEVWTMQEWLRRAEVLGLNPMVATFLHSAAGREILMTRLVPE
ncbi:putative hybrid NRPS/PKS enzyme [Aspergillus heteromorphus CBS 117.55]|uniref:Putative hybrid NRPS/PKS enzyme n=1 Tax=Aspergillus heteromorphus CBS 117.55 TaxID=1448321 RepID=A0A317W5M4_9EURO|nr:putative hybrid NRPS/PKS enzyme [Aspergillus heteromorphus CBS 117.55]PWY81896.1 putative hybrid NRPS/PKS enzyme [Aspergillus heteromorphus CBS 117.55]